MFKTALNKNIIPHTWKLAKIVPIQKPNKDTDKGTSYMPTSLLSVIAKTLEKSLLPYITVNIPNTPMQHGYKTSRDAKPTQHIEIIHPNVNLKLAFHKVATFNPHYLTFTPQTYHHPVHRFRSWPTQTTSQSHPQVRVQPRNTYNHTYIQFLPGQNKTTSY